METPVSVKMHLCDTIILPELVGSVWVCPTASPSARWKSSLR